MLVRDVPVERIAPGDVVSVVRPDGIRVRRRVLTAQMSASYVTLTLKGDANQDPDAEPVVVREAQELVWAVPSVAPQPSSRVPRAVSSWAASSPRSR